MPLINVKLIGLLRGLAGKDVFEIEVEGTKKITMLLDELLGKVGREEFRRAVIDPELGSPRPNLLILINGREISSLSGLETTVGESDEVVLVPVSHGG